MVQSSNGHIKPSSLQLPPYTPQMKHFLFWSPFLISMKQLRLFQRAALPVEFISLLFYLLQCQLESVGRVWVSSPLNRYLLQYARLNLLRLWTYTVITVEGIWSCPVQLATLHEFIVSWFSGLVMVLLLFPQATQGPAYLVSKRTSQLER